MGVGDDMGGMLSTFVASGRCAVCFEVVEIRGPVDVNVGECWQAIESASLVRVGVGVG